MTAIRNAAFALAAAAALAPAAAHARDLDRPRNAVPPKVHVVPGVVNAGWSLRVGHDGRGPDWDRGVRDGGPGWRDQAGRHDRWKHRAHERAELRAAYARLDLARARFHAHPHRRGELLRFERWYARERAALDVRWKVLVAWR